MLFFFTWLVDFLAMTITLWMAFYLLGRGFPSRVTLRAVISLLALSGFFYGAHNNLFEQVAGTASLRAILLIVGLASWYSLTLHLTPERAQKRLRWMEMIVYGLAGVTIVLLFTTRNAFVGEVGNVLYVGRMGFGLPYALYSAFLIFASSGILYSLLSDTRFGLTPQGRFFLLASIFPIVEVGYGILALALTPPMPRLIQDLLIFCGIFLLGVSVARYQSLLERRITVQDFPVSGITLIGISTIYTFFAWKWGIKPELLATVAAFAIITHSAYDLVREFLDRLRVHKENEFRRQLRQIDSERNNRVDLTQNLQDGIELLCCTIDATRAFVAVYQAESFVVTATFQSIPMGKQISPDIATCEDICDNISSELPEIEWVAPAFSTDRQVAILGIGSPKTKLNYSSDDLDLLAEVADRVGLLISTWEEKDNADREVDDQKTEEITLLSKANDMMAMIKTNPDPGLVKMVEESLRNLTDYIALGQSPLVDLVAVTGESHIEHGKNLQRILISAIDLLRPPGQRPSEPLPRVWYNYAVLHDAYVEEVPNREIMARLYISEGTFNRTRRNALRGLTRLLIEKGTLNVH